MQFRTGVVLGLLAVMALSVPANGQGGILYDDLLKSRPNSSTTFRASSVDATTGRTSDSTEWIPTSGWERATLQHSFADSAGVDSTEYTIFARWSNDGVTAFLSDSLPPETVEGSANLDSLIIRPAKYMKLCVRANPGNESGGGATTYAIGTMRLLVKGRVR